MNELWTATMIPQYCTIGGLTIYRMRDPLYIGKLLGCRNSKVPVTPNSDTIAFNYCCLNTRHNHLQLTQEDQDGSIEVCTSADIYT
jgi:hypothetical protein